MKVKLFEGLLHIAIALSLIDWSSRTDEGATDLGPYLEFPFSTRHGMPDYSDILRPSNPASITKDDDETINNILNWEENQIPNANLDLVAFPIVSQTQSFQNEEPEPATPPSVSDINSLPESSDWSASNGQSISSANSWQLSPVSTDDEELFGAVGYTPQQNSDDFDIESFLGRDLSPPSASFDELYPYPTRDSILSPNWIEGATGPSEAGEGLAQFLQDSIETSEEDCSKKQYFPSEILNYPDKIHKSLTDLYDENNLETVLRTPRSTSSKDKMRIPDIEEVLTDDLYYPEHGSPIKGRTLADIQSYEDDRDTIEPLFSDKDIKSETLSPTRKTATRSDAAKSEPFDISNIDFSKGLFDELLEPKSAKSVSELSSKVWSNLPYTREDIIHMDIDEFNSVISALDPLQQHIGKDIRRRGKNKIAARNCRKRKVEAIDQLETVVDQTDKERKALLNERAMLQEETADIVRKTAYLYEHIFKNLRDERGQPYSNDKYALTYTGDGSVYLVPKTPEQKPITVR